LIVEDEAPLRNAMVRHFEDIGFNVASAGNGVEALERMRTKLPDLMLLDIRMPQLDGPGVLTEMRRQGWRIPVVMLTASEDVEETKRCFKLGAWDFLTKPVNLGFIEKTVYWHLRA
jgi:DNA-binding response OmpR family regulator